VSKVILLVAPFALVLSGMFSPVQAQEVVCRDIDTVVTINWKGLKRTFHIYSPASSGPRPTVLGFHGATGSADSATDKQAAQIANKQGWNFVSMQAYEGFWMLENGSPDYELINYVIGLISSNYCGDSSRVYALGFSMGAMMVSLVACQTNLFKAVVPISGVVSTQSRKCRSGVAVRAIHSTDDPTVLINGDLASGLSAVMPPYLMQQPSRLSTVKRWGKEFNGCDKFVIRYPREGKRVYVGLGCDTVTSFVKYSYGKHNPPNQATTSMRFFVRVDAR
jgi:poly(3-hydroxybutyrate) depolymerase